MMNRFLLLFLGLIAIAGAGVGYYFYTQAEAAKNPQAAAAAEARELVAAVGKLIILPDEEPIIATVADPSELNGQPFFERAQVGDKLLIFNNARKAVLYNPAENLIVEVAPLSLGGQPSPTP